MKRIILCLSLFAFFGSQAQQINPVPDYVFSNKMSVGRNAVTDTAAYFSIGPRYGAIRGMMPPMVTDTASMSATKRNGLLIFSIQKNKYLYWDSVGSKWAEMAGTAGSAITGSGVAGYMPEFTTSTNLDTTRLYHSSGRFAIGSTTTTNGVFNVYGGQSYFDTSLKVGSQTLLADEGKNEVYVNTTTDAGAYALQVAGSIYNTTGAVFAASSGSVGIRTSSPGYTLDVTGDIRATNYVYANAASITPLLLNVNDADLVIQNSANKSLNFQTNNVERARIRNTGEFLIGYTASQGTYALQNNGNFLTNGDIRTAAPTGGTANDWRLGTVATVTPTSPNRTIEVSIGGTIYYIHAKTTND